MEFKQVSKYLANPSLLNGADIHVLQRWADKYPQVSLFKVFLAFKGLENPQDNISSKYLENAAFYVPDRRKLKKLLQEWKNLPQVETFVAEEPVAEEIQADANFALEENLSEVIHTDIPENIEELVEESKEEATAETLSLEEVLSADEIVSEEASTVTEIPEEQPLSEEITEENTAETLTLEEVLAVDDVIVETKSNEIALAEIPTEIKEDIAPQEIVDDTEESITEEDDIAFLQSIGKYEAEAIEPQEAVVHLEAEPAGSGIFEIEEEGSSESGLAQTDISWLAPWLEDFDFPVLSQRKSEQKVIEIQATETPLADTSSVNTEHIKEAEPEVETVEEAEIPVSTQEKQVRETIISVNNPATELNTTHSFEEWLKIVDTQIPAETSKPVFELPERDILSEIKSEPAKPVKKSVIPPQPENPQDVPVQEVQRLASESVLVNKDMATETLALIFLKQGKPEKAIDTYQKLMLKYPEKSSYFASQIKKIQES